MDANSLRKTFTDFFVERGHTLVPSAGLIPHHPLAPLFTNAGMNQFLPYFLGEEAAPYERATSVQKCVRIRGKHDDIELIGRTTRHLTFFEMLGNFSFGDYFKEGAIKFHWDLFTNVLGLDGDDIWVTVHHSDDDAADIWRDTIGVPAERIQRMGEDNFWEMGDTGPCGPCSELYIDRGPQFGDAGGPAEGDDERYRELGNLVFMQFDRQGDGELIPLPKQNIDTGSGFERILATVEGVNSIWDTSAIRPIIAKGEALSSKTYGDDEENDVSLRILADHSRSMTFLVNDGVFPSNEDRGYVLRRIVRRMLRHAYKLGVHRDVTAGLIEAVADTMGTAYPEIEKNKDFITEVLSREEHRFGQTLQSGSTMLEQAMQKADVVPGETAFKLHDTFGFPIELTQEMAAEAGKSVDIDGFTSAMEAQRRQAREAAKSQKATGISTEAYREIIDKHGPTEFLAYQRDDVDSKVLAVLVDPNQEGHVEIFLASTPFYAEQGGQVGDTGHITTDTGAAVVTDTTFALPGLIRHSAQVTDGRIEPNQEAHAVIDTHRRAAIRRNHTGTHILHWALREVLGDHVKQAGSLVAPDRLRFDFSHFSAVTPEQLIEIERLANDEILSDGHVEVIETTQAEALAAGAIAFFGEKYGEKVRMLQAGAHSLELCGGTHVDALGKIGPIKITSEGSIGSNLRRIEAVTGTASFDYIRHQEASLAQAAAALKAKPDELVSAIERTLAKQKQLDDEIKSLRAQARKVAAKNLISTQSNGFVVARVDDTPPDQLRELAIDIRQTPEVNAVVLIGSPDGSSVSLVAAVDKNAGLQASDLLAPAAKVVGGGGGKGADLAMAGGRDASKIDEAIATVREQIPNESRAS